MLKYGKLALVDALSGTPGQVPSLRTAAGPPAAEGPAQQGGRASRLPAAGAVSAAVVPADGAVVAPGLERRVPAARRNRRPVAPGREGRR